MAIKPITVTQLNEQISRIIMNDPLLGNVTVKGEISNLNYHYSGHVYFSISDQVSKVNCFFPENYVKSVNFQLENGQEVIINGYVNVYKKGGTYTLFVKSIDREGIGDLSLAFQKLKDRLEKEGLFDQKHKQDIPEFPKKVGVITSKTGAAVEDIKKTISMRTNLTDIIIFPTQVQGEGAAEDIAYKIDYVNAHFSDIDTLIVGRGGGSLEDLWAFNEECVARAIYNSHIPIISAVGHETDTSISDFVADKRAATPTAAAQMAVPDLRDIIQKIKAARRDLFVQLNRILTMDELYVKNFHSEMKNEIFNKVGLYQNKLENLKLILEANSPNTILDKGYGIFQNDRGNVITSIKELEDGSVYSVRLRDGTAKVKINIIGKD